jgi:23S rRNA pseudouridine1911/1915/1917 synthase
VAGDAKYGARTNPINRLALHAHALHFIHPSTREPLHFQTPVPKRFLLLAKRRARN